MPYIKKEDRSQLDPLIDALAEKLGDPDTFAGNLNYAITRLAAKMALKNLRYRTLSQIHGVFQDAATEFYRRIVAPYEDKQIQNKGDVAEYDELKKLIDKL